MRVYATVDDLEDELSGSATPVAPDRLLALASTVVDLMLVGTVYPTLDGLPNDPADSDLLRRLTVLQAVWMAQDPDSFQQGIIEARTSTVSVKRSDTSPGRPRFAPRAVEYLQATGWPGYGLVVRR